MPNGHVDGPVNGHVNGHEHTNGVNGENHSTKSSLRLSFADYKRISNLIVLHLRRAEEGEISGFWSVRSFTLKFFINNSIFIRDYSNYFTTTLHRVFYSLLTVLVCVCVDEEEEALKKSAVVNWYLKEIESDIDSEMELINKKAMIEKVIHRLVHYVSALNKTFTLPTSLVLRSHSSFNHINIHDS